MTAPIILPWPLQNSMEIAARLLLHAGDLPSIDFLRPAGEAALVPADSVSWRVFKNPLSLFVGGVTAVIMELAEPRVRAGVWEHTTFRSDPLRRLRTPDGSSRHGDGLRCSQRSGAHDRPRSANAPHGRRHHVVGRTVSRQ